MKKAKLWMKRGGMIITILLLASVILSACAKDTGEEEAAARIAELEAALNEVMESGEASAEEIADLEAQLAEAEAEAAAEAEAEAAAEAEAEAAGPVEIIWYGTAPQVVLDEVAAKFTETHEGITLIASFTRGPELAQKVEAEAAADKGEACMIMLPTLSALEDFRRRGLLLEYHSPEEAGYPEWFVEPGWWIGIRVLDVPLVYNTNLIDEAPTSWEVLADPQFKGKIAFTDAGAIGGPPVVTYKLLRDKYGEDFWPKVVENEPFIREQTGQVLEQLLNDEIAFGWMYGYNALLGLRGNPNAPIGMVWVDPTPMLAAFNALLSGCPNIEEAKVVYDWLASVEGQQVIVDANRTVSGKEGVDLGPGRLPLDEMPWIALDLKAFAAEEEEVKAEWRKVFGRE